MDGTRSASCLVASRASPSNAARSLSIRARVAVPRTPGSWIIRAAAMLSRTADNLYWLSRYVERAEYLARILEATHRLAALPVSYAGASNEWESALATAGCAGAFEAVYSEANEETVTDFLAFSSGNSSSIRSCFEIARA